ncbi:MAG: hypothetical protein ACREEM_05715 [Blastocatellia bacterium]
MNPGLITLVVVIIAFVLVFLLMRSRKKNDEPVKVEYVIGNAKAFEAEQRRKAAGNTGKSPMSDLKYDFWLGEQGLMKDGVPANVRVPVNVRGDIEFNFSPGR